MDRKAEELSAMVDEIRSRVRALHPNGEASGIPLADLMPLVVARDAAEGKVASIGTVNPRPAGFKNAAIQWVKRNVARALDWHVREQVEFNRAAMDCVQATFEALSETNRALAAFSSPANPATRLRAPPSPPAKKKSSRRKSSTPAISPSSNAPSNIA